MKRVKTLSLVVGIFSLAALVSCRNNSGYYNRSDFAKVPKTDVHFHYNSTDGRYVKFAFDSMNFRLVSPNVDSEIPLDSQLNTAGLVHHNFPGKFAFFGTFSVDSFGREGFAENTVARIEKCMKAGACGIKIWKNIGMVLKNKEGKFVMVDDPAFDQVFDYLEANNIMVMAHLGEPRNCWLPEDQMTVDNDRRYYANHPQYHMFKHPEAPSYEDQIRARDNLLKKHPKLRLVGAHLASLEWNVDELAKHFDQYPNLKADLAARIGHLQYQSRADYDRVRNFMIKYQDRLMYGTDGSVSQKDTSLNRMKARMRSGWLDHWMYLATDSPVVVKDLAGQKVKGLHLPKEVIDKLYSKNAAEFFSF